MYKLLLCWRDPRTRYIALASIVSVMLGVATMIVVNSVMAGFAHEMQERIRGILSSVVVESTTLQGFPNVEWHKDEILRVAGEYIDGMTATVHTAGMLSFNVRGQWITRQVNFIGIEEATHGQVSDFSKYLQHPDNRQKMSFTLRPGGYDVRDHQGDPDTPERPGMEVAGWQWRRMRSARDRAVEEARRKAVEINPQNAAAPSGPVDPFAARQPVPEQQFDPSREQHTGVVLGMALVSFRQHDGVDRFLSLPGDDVKVSFLTAGMPPKIVSDTFTIVDFYESKMSEYDSSFVFVPLEWLQFNRGMIDPSTGIGNVTALQIKLKNDAQAELVRDKLKAAFRPDLYNVATRRDKQGALLAAVQMETAVLNILLFMIIAVSGFGILAIFCMIVVEKTRDIGILKSLGAPATGILGIFLTYGLLLGIVGSGVGMGIGLLFVRYINEIRTMLEKMTGTPVFDPSIYYFYKIPTIVEPWTVAWIVLGALVIAVLASILPAFRAATLRPVEALRYE